MSERREDRTKPQSGIRPGRSPGGGPGGHLMGPKERAKNAQDTLLRIWGYLKHQRWALIGTVILVAASSGLGLLGPYLMGKAIDQYILTKDIPGLARTALLMICIYVVSSFTTWLQTYVMSAASQGTIRDIRKDLFSKLQTLSLRFFDQRTHGELMSRLSNDIESISRILTQSVTQLISSTLSTIGVIIIMFMLNVRLAVVSLTAMPLMLLLSQWIAKRARPGFREQQEHLGALNGIIEETLTGQHAVKAYVREESAIEEFEVSNRKLQRAAFRARIFSGAMGPLGGLVRNFSLAVVGGVGGWLAVQGMATVGTIASFINYSRRFTRPLNEIASIYSSIQSALAGAERVFEIIDQVPELADAPDAQPLNEIAGEVVFNHVCFGYVEDTPVLKNVSLHAKPGQTIALVGPTGAGKTTIVNLLTRFYDIDSGNISIDGNDIRQVKKDDLRRKLGIVLQDTYLFSETVNENIRYGRLDATNDEIKAAATLANADTFIHRLPKGYDTSLSERGSNLSQGQRQLLAIARAILADPGILILDEATSSVDTRTEKQIQEAMLHLMAGRTSFVIAHRLSTIREADRILVINDGEIIERGTHRELLAQRGFYHNLYMSQFKGQQQLVPEVTL